LLWWQRELRRNAMQDERVYGSKSSRFLDARTVEICGAKDRFPIFRRTFFDSMEIRMVQGIQDQFVGGNER
jgi:hypothetical protein